MVQFNRGKSKRFWLMQPDRAAQIMIKAVAKRRRVLVFPLPMRLLFIFRLSMLDWQ